MPYNKKSWCKPNNEQREFTTDEMEEILELAEQYDSIGFEIADLLNVLREAGSFEFLELRPKYEQLIDTHNQFAESVKSKALSPSKLPMSKICALTTSIETQQQKLMEELGRIKLKEASGVPIFPLSMQEKIWELIQNYGKPVEEEKK